MRLYVAGFLFSTDRKKVVLIRKTHPEWQAGKLNGAGGKMENLETPIHAMNREWEEEVSDIPVKWSLFATLEGANGHYAGEPGSDTNDVFRVYFFRSFGEIPPVRDGGKTDTQESIEILDVSDLPLERTVSNCQWLVPMALTMEDTPVSVYRVQEGY